MATDKLGWDNGAKRWRKFFQGKWHALSPRGTKKTDKAAYDAALNQWHAIRGAAAQQTEEHRQEMLSVKRQLTQMSADYNKLVDAPAFPYNVDELVKNGLVDAWIAHQAAFTATGANSTLAEAVTTFLELKSASVADSTYNNLLARLTWLRSVLGDAFPMRAIDEAAVLKIKTAVLTKGDVARGGSAFDTFKTVMSFLKWAGKQRLLASIPLNLDLEMIPKPVPEDADPMPLDQWHTLYAAAPDRVRLYMLLAANCGYTQADIADLSPEEYDGEYLCRKRKKTERHASTPKIEQKLWPETVQLLEKFKGTGKYLVPNDDGGPILQRVAGKNKIDNVNTSWSRLKTKTKLVDMYPFGSIKKRSASLLHAHREFRPVERMILGRGIPGVDRRYIEEHFPLYHEGQDYLHTVYFPQK